ncbi:MAG: hypothetical protein ACI4U1_07220 [Anaerovoracaceae bacterium]
MVKNIKNIIISTMLCIILMLQTTFVYANEQEIINNANAFGAFDFCEMLEDSGVSSIEIKTAAGKKLQYSFTLPSGQEASATEYKDAVGNRYFEFVEGNLSNSLILKSNGKIILDGKEVTVEISSASYQTDRDINIGNVVEPYGRHYNVSEYLEVCPYGSASDYSVYVSSKTVNIAFQRAVRNITVGALASIICSIVAALPFVNVYVGAALSVGSGIFLGIADYMKERTPEAVASKAYIKRYQHRNGHRVPAVVTGESRFVYKDVYTYYVDIGESNLVYLKKQNLYLVNRIMS